MEAVELLLAWNPVDGEVLLMFRNMSGTVVAGAEIRIAILLTIVHGDYMNLIQMNQPDITATG
jgi:hypothetical protein